MRRLGLSWLIAGSLICPAFAETVEVSDLPALRRAASAAKPGTTIRVAPGIYPDGMFVKGPRGEPDRPIVIEAADPKNPPVFRGGGESIHFAGPAHLTVRNLTLEGASGNGLNIDDGGDAVNSAHHITLVGIVVRDVGPKGNHDGIKLSGIDDFRVENCTLERWGSGGSGIDMVGCHRGLIVGCTFRHGDTVGDSGVQAKGGSSEVVVRGCRFEHAGSRAVNLGGSTGLPFFRPKDAGYEAKDLTVEDCTFIGSHAPIAFVGVDGAVVRRNTFYRPNRFAIRILQESTAPRFAPSRNGRFLENLVVFRSNEMVMAANVGPGTAPDTFTFSGNAWYCLDNPARSRPNLPTPERDGIHGKDPRLTNPEQGDLRLAPDSPLKGRGAGAS